MGFPPLRFFCHNPPSMVQVALPPGTIAASAGPAELWNSAISYDPSASAWLLFDESVVFPPGAPTYCILSHQRTLFFIVPQFDQWTLYNTNILPSCLWCSWPHSDEHLEDKIWLTGVDREHSCCLLLLSDDLSCVPQKELKVFLKKMVCEKRTNYHFFLFFLLFYYLAIKLHFFLYFSQNFQKSLVGLKEFVALTQPECTKSGYAFICAFASFFWRSVTVSFSRF